jgi:hypothetical protein
VTARWRPDAQAEADAAAEPYRDKRREFGRRFRNSLAEALSPTELPPQVYREVEPGISKCRLKTLPYALILRGRMGIESLAVMHLRRRPGDSEHRA